MATPERGGQTYRATTVKTETRTIPKTETPLVPPRKGLLKRLRQALFFAATRVIPSAVLLGGGGLAAQHHVQEQEKPNPSGITADIQGIPSTAEKDLDALAKKLGLNVHLESKVALYNPDSTKEQIIKAGVNGNTQAITLEAVQDFMNQKPPITEPAKEGAIDGTVKVIFPVDPENANNVKVVKITKVARGYKNIDYHMAYQRINIKGENVPFYLPVLEGAQKVEAKAEVTWGLSTILLRYFLGDGRVVSAYLNFSDNNFMPTKELKDIPTYNPNVVKTSEEVDAIPTKEFNLRKNPFVRLFNVSGSSRVDLQLYAPPTPTTNILNLDSSFATDNGGDLLYPPSSPSGD